MFSPKSNKIRIIDQSGQMWELTPTKEVGVYHAVTIYEPDGYPGTEKYEESITKGLNKLIEEPMEKPHG